MTNLQMAEDSKHQPLWALFSLSEAHILLSFFLENQLFPTCSSFLKPTPTTPFLEGCIAPGITASYILAESRPTLQSLSLRNQDRAQGGKISWHWKYLPPNPSHNSIRALRQACEVLSAVVNISRVKISTAELQDFLFMAIARTLTFQDLHYVGHTCYLQHWEETKSCVFHLKITKILHRNAAGR